MELPEPYARGSGQGRSHKAPMGGQKGARLRTAGLGRGGAGENSVLRTGAGEAHAGTFRV